jgi:CBS domain-containing protein
MPTLAFPRVPRPLVLRSTTAAELMTPGPLSFELHTPIHKAAALLNHHRLDAAPVVNDDDQPLALVTAAACAAWEEFSRRAAAGRGPQAQPSTADDATPVSLIATPNIELVPLDAPSQAVIDALVERGARRVYVVDNYGALVGLISMYDILSQLDEGHPGWRVPRSGAAHLC